MVGPEMENIGQNKRHCEEKKIFAPKITYNSQVEDTDLG